MCFDEVWTRIIDHAGEEFRTKTGLPFTYEQVDNNTLVRHRPGRVDVNLTKESFRKYYDEGPLDGPDGFKNN